MIFINSTFISMSQMIQASSQTHKGEAEIRRQVTRRELAEEQSGVICGRLCGVKRFIFVFQALHAWQLELDICEGKCTVKSSLKLLSSTWWNSLVSQGWSVSFGFRGKTKQNNDNQRGFWLSVFHGGRGFTRQMFHSITGPPPHRSQGSHMHSQEVWRLSKPTIHPVHMGTLCRLESRPPRFNYA